MNREMIRYAKVAVFVVLCIANVNGHCSLSTYIMASTTLSPDTHSHRGSRCLLNTYFYTSPPGTTLTIDCPVFDVSCFFRGGNWFRVQRKDRLCDHYFTPVETGFNYLEVQYKTVRSPWANMDFQCNIKVEYPPDLLDTSCDCDFPSTSPAGIQEGKDHVLYVASVLHLGKYMCGGTLVSGQWVLSSAACDIQTSYKVKLGSQTSDGVSSVEITKGIAEVINHPQFYGGDYRFDIALLYLDEPIPSSSHTRPACLPFNLLTSSLAGEKAIGYKSVQGNGASMKDLQAVELEVISNEQCAEKHGYHMNDESLCTIKVEEEVCHRYGGIPLTHNADGFNYLIGMSSFGTECGRTKKPSVYIRIANPAILHWITTTTDFKCFEVPQPSPVPPEKTSSECDVCGTRKSGFHTRVVGGENAEPGEFPYQVSITDMGSHFCGGSLISKDWVVSAAHCEVNARRHRITLGQHSLKRKSSVQVSSKIKNVINHPDYNDDNMHFDIAIVQLENEVDFTDYIRPICLPDYFKSEDFFGKFVEVSGWGVLDYDDYNSAIILQKATLDVISHKQCNEIYKEDFFDENICTHTIGKDACLGDSGGPLAYQYEGRFYLVGVTSWGIGCADSRYPGVYSSMAHPNMLNWVKENAGIKCMAGQSISQQQRQPTQSTPTSVIESSTNNPQICECGKKKLGLFNRIVGGKIAEKGEFPFQVSFATNDYQYCGGSLISNEWIVTAAHCEINTETDYVVMGEHNIRTKSGDEVYRSIDSFIIHPSYTSNSSRFDIALVKLNAPVDFTDYIHPICLPDKFTSKYFEGKDAQATGWGALQYESVSAIRLNKVTLDVISYDECKDVFEDYIFEENMCTSTPGKDACQGDSGGPLSYQLNSISYLIGVVSWGFECAHPDYPGVYISMTNPSILSWVKENSGMKCVAP